MINRILILSFLALCSGCVFGLPLDTKEHVGFFNNGRKPIGKTGFSIFNKETTFDEIIFAIGEPDLVYSDKRMIEYRWEVTSGYFFLYFAPPPIPYYKTYYLHIYFDEQNKFTNYELTTRQQSL